MTTQPMYPNYMGYPTNTLPNQPRMDGYEQGYPAFMNSSQYMNIQRPMQPQSQVFSAQNFVKCRAVTSIDEAKASMIDLDGSVHVFTDLANKRIYTKQINLDGTASLNIYVMEEDNSSAETNLSTNQYVERDELESVCNSLNERINEIQKMFSRMEKTISERNTVNREQSKGAIRK